MRITYIDKLKGWAIMFVMMGHLSKYSIGIDDTPFNALYGAIDMPLFMFLSGIFAYKHLRSYNMAEIGAFLRKKFLRLIIPFITIGGFYGIWACGNPLHIYDNTISFYWFLPTLFICMILGLVTNILSTKIMHDKAYFYILIVVFLAACSLYISGVRFPYFLNTLKMFPFFILGVIYAKYAVVREKINRSNALYSAAVVILLLMFFVDKKIFTHFNFAGIFTIIVLLQLFIRYDKKIPNILACVGNYSLEIYVFHIFLLPALSFVKIYMDTYTPDCILLKGNFILMIILTSVLAACIAAVCIIISKVIRHSKLLNAVCFGTLSPKQEK